MTPAGDWILKDGVCATPITSEGCAASVEETNDVIAEDNVNLWSTRNHRTATEFVAALR